jgi:hypothetical protein
MGGAIVLAMQVLKDLILAVGIAIAAVYAGKLLAMTASLVF